MPPSKAALAKIHIAKKELHLTDEVYRDILRSRFRVESAARLTDRQASILIDTFKAKGWHEKRSRKKSTSPHYEAADTRKVVALWIALHQAGIVRDRSDRALQAYVKRQTGIDSLAWCNGAEVRILIESLKKWALREGVDVNC